MIKKYSLVSACLFVILFLSCATQPFVTGQSESQEKRNVIFVIADQYRGDALSILGHPDVETPNLDRLAKEGVAFRNHFANNPVCTPSRMSMWSSKYPHEHGTLTNKPGPTFPSTTNTMLGWFEEQNYQLGWFGKDNHGFNRDVLSEVLDAHSNRKREPFRAYYPNVAPHWYSNTPWPKEELYAYKTTSDVISFAEESGDQPFFAVLSLFDPHPPYFAPSDYVNKYLKKDLHIPDYIDPRELGDRFAKFWKAMGYEKLDESDLRSAMAHYYAAIEWGIDAQMGRLQSALKDMSKDQNTIIAFTSEHGDYMGQHGGLRKSMFLHDALLHVPMIWHAPGVVQAQGVLDDLSQGIDIFPTILGLLGEGAIASHSGLSHADRLKKIETQTKNEYLIASAGYSELPENYFDNPESFYTESQEEGNTPFHTRIFRRVTQVESRTVSIRTDQWKLILNETEDPQLYEVSTLIKESKNVAPDPRNSNTLAELSKIAADSWDWSLEN